MCIKAKRSQFLFGAVEILIACALICFCQSVSGQLSPEKMQLVREYQNQRIEAIQRVEQSVIAIYGEDRGGGGSGVVISPSGLALTNHHVIAGAGVAGWGGMSGDKMYRWKLIGTDPGGDVSLIQMISESPLPWSPLGDSDQVRVGDWALAMGNPFILTEDQSPTVTLGIVSGVKRYQYGAGKNQLVYGNCIQVDSSINPGNSGGPLFNFNGEVIGINGRGSFEARGRVNVGLGYAISSNQIRNFIPDLLATKLTEHGTLDCNFSDRNGKVVCSTINKDAPAARAGLQLGDELIEFEGVEITTANQFTNLICTLPESWPARLKLQTPTGQVKEFTVRLLGLPYARPQVDRRTPGSPKKPPKKDDKRPPTKKEQERLKNLQMIELLSAKPGTVRNRETNLTYTRQLLSGIQVACGVNFGEEEVRCCRLVDKVDSDTGEYVLRTSLANDGRWVVERFGIGALHADGVSTEAQALSVFFYDGETYKRLDKVERDSTESNSEADQASNGGELVWQTRELSVLEAKLILPALQAMVCASINRAQPLGNFGDPVLDGSDRSGCDVTFRFIVQDSEEEPIYVWARVDQRKAHAAGQIVKASAYLDCVDEENPAGVAFSDWKNIEGTSIASTRKFIVGLDEKVVAELAVIAAQRLDQEAFEAQMEKLKKQGRADEQ